MTKEKIIEIIARGEGIDVEFKTTFNDEVIVSLVAFTNSKGGKVFIGISDKGEVRGIQVGKETIQGWINQVKNKTSPAVIPDEQILDFYNKAVVVLNAIEYPIKPVSFKGRYYKRIGNSNHLMTVDEIANEHLKSINSSWDFYPDPIHGIDHISSEKVNRFIKNIERLAGSDIKLSQESFLNKFEFVRDNKLTFGAYLLFVKDYCSISDIQVGRFKSETKIIDSISLNTDLFSEVEEVLAFIKKHLMVEYIITGEPQRVERFDYPIDAIREIVINMIHPVRYDLIK